MHTPTANYNWKETACSLTCSPRAHGNSEAASQYFAQGFSQKELPMQICALRDYAISPCIACYHCERDVLGRCPLSKQDTSLALFDILLHTPALHIAAPIFFYHLPASMKALLDRGQSYWIRKLRNNETITSLPQRPAWITLIAGRTRGEKLFEGSLVSLRYFLSIFNFTIIESTTLLGHDEATSIESSLFTKKQLIIEGKDAASYYNTVYATKIA